MSTSNKNFLSPNNFRFDIQALPDVSFMCQRVGVPGISIGKATQPSRVLDIPRVGEKMTFDDLSISFMVDEDLNNYVSMFNWMKGIASPFSLEKRQGLDNEGPMYSDATLSILNSKGNPNRLIKFRNIAPISMSTMDFSTTESDVVYIKVDVTFLLESFEMLR